MKPYSAIILLALLLIGSHAYGQQAWRDAIRGDWRKSPYAKTLPPFCGTNPKYKNTSMFDRPEYAGDMPWANHLCAALTKIPICHGYGGSQRIECLRANGEGYTYWIQRVKNPNFPLLPYLYTGLGELYAEMGEHGNAIQQCHLALNKNPKYIKAYKCLIDSYIAQGEYQSAAKYVDEAIAIKPLKLFKSRREKIKRFLN